MFESPVAVGDGQWLVGGARVEAVDGGFRAAPTALAGVAFSSAVRTAGGWLFWSDLAQRLWHADGFLAPLELVTEAPTDVLWTSVPSGGGALTLQGSDGVLYVSEGNTEPRPATGSANAFVLAARVEPNGEGVAYELGGRSLRTTDGGRSWRPGAPATARDIATLIYADEGEGPSPEMAGVVAAVIHRFDALAAAPMMVTAPWMVARSGASVLIEAFGTVWSVDARADVVRARVLAAPEEDCRLHPAGLVLCASGAFSVGFDGERRRLARWPSRAPIVAVAEGLRPGEALLELGCDGEAGHRCLIDLAAGEATTLDVALDMDGLFAFARDTALVGSGSSLALVDLRTARATPITAPPGTTDWQPTLLADRSILFQHPGNGIESVDAFLLQDGESRRLALPERARLLHMFDALHGIVATDTHVLATTDGGERWVPQTDHTSSLRAGVHCRGSACVLAGHAVALTGQPFGGTVERPSIGDFAVRHPTLECDGPVEDPADRVVPLRLQITPRGGGRQYTLTWNDGGRRRQATVRGPADLADPFDLTAPDVIARSASATLIGFCADECGKLLLRSDGTFVPLTERHDPDDEGPSESTVLLELTPTDHVIGRGGREVVRVRGDEVERVRLITAPTTPAVLVDGALWSAGALGRPAERNRAGVVSPGGESSAVVFHRDALGRGCPDGGDGPHLVIPIEVEGGYTHATLAIRQGSTPCLDWVSAHGVRWRVDAGGVARGGAEGPVCRVRWPAD